MKPSRLPVVLLIKDALQELGRKWRVLVPALILPSAAWVVVSWSFENYATDGLTAIIVWFTYAPFYVLFAVSCHRTLILGAEYLPNAWGLYWTRRETAFFGWFIGIVILTAVLSFLSAFLYLVTPAADGAPALVWVLEWVVYFFVSYFVMRFSMVLPAAALEHRLTFADSWATTRGNGAVLALAVCVPAALTALIFWILDSSLGDSEAWLSSVPYLFVWLILLAVEIAILSIAYKYLVFVSPDEGDRA